MPWRLFNWGSRGATYDVGGGYYVPEILIPNCIQGTVKGQNVETLQEYLTVLHFYDTNPVPAAGAVSSVAGILAGWVTASLVPFTRNDIRVVEVAAITRAEVDGPETFTFLDILGTRTDDVGNGPLSSNVTLALEKTTGLSGRSQRGRLYVWPFWQADLSTTTPDEASTTFVGLAVACYTALKTAAAAGGYPLGVASNVKARILQPINIGITDATIDNQRRRLPGRGA